MRIPIILIIVLFTLSFLTDFWIWKDLRRYTLKSWISKSYAVSAVICWIFLIVILCLPRRESGSGIVTIMWLLYAYALIYISKLVYCLFSLLGLIPHLWRHKRINSSLWIGLPAAIVIFFMGWWGAIVGRNEIEIKKVTIESQKIPEIFNGYRIVQFSDAHVGTWGNDTSFISRLVSEINEQKPDLIVFTGDIVNRETSEIVPFVKILKKLKSRDGVISVLGNHDYGDYITWSNPDLRESNNARLAEYQTEMGWTLLNNASYPIRRGNDSIMIIGVENWGEPPFHQYGDLRKAYPEEIKENRGLNDKNYKILLSHNPEHWRLEAGKISNIDLTLSGHTHAMQFMISKGNFRWSPSQYRYENWGGLYKDKAKDGNPMYLYVNIGSGEVALPFRIGAIPEVTVITLKKTPRKNKHS